MARWAMLAVLGLTLANCGRSPNSSKYGVSASPRVVEPGQPVPKGGGSYRVGKPYVVGGRSYTPEENRSYSAEGLASWYGADFHGRLTANREVYDMNAISAAHPTLPMPSYVRVTNLSNRRSIVVRVNDRGPYHQGRVIDVSARAAKLLGFYDSGTTRVRVDYVGRAAIEGSDDTKLAATLRHGGETRRADARRHDEAHRYSVASRDRAASETRHANRYDEPPARRSSRPVRTGGSVEREYFDPRPLTQRGALVPPERAPEPRQAPSRDGHTVARAPLAPPAGRISGRPARSAAAETSFDSRFAPASTIATAPGRTAPVSAYAPAPRAESVMTGRGLY